MKIWVMRHGEAGFNASSDSQRTLTENGETMAYTQGQWLGKRLLDQSIIFDKVIVSPYIRTQQTVEHLCQGMKAVGYMQSFANIIETWQGITPSGDPNNVMDYLSFLNEEGAKHILIVSHLPLVFDLVQHLTQYQQCVHFYPAVIAEVDWNSKTGHLITSAFPSR
ncbi:phosphohistidine phosphatase SixA [Ursidibacter sp. B-7004-1]